METPSAIEQLWDNLLSRQQKLVRAAFEALGEDEQVAVLVHLRKMTSEPDWHPEQRTSALVALEALNM